MKKSDLIHIGGLAFLIAAFMGLGCFAVYIIKTAGGM